MPTLPPLPSGVEWYPPPPEPELAGTPAVGGTPTASGRLGRENSLSPKHKESTVGFVDMVDNGPNSKRDSNRGGGNNSNNSPLHDY